MLYEIAYALGVSEMLYRSDLQCTEIRIEIWPDIYPHSYRCQDSFSREIATKQL